VVCARTYPSSQKGVRRNSIWGNCGGALVPTLDPVSGIQKGSRHLKGLQLHQVSRYQEQEEGVHCWRFHLRTEGDRRRRREGNFFISRRQNYPGNSSPRSFCTIGPSSRMTGRGKGAIPGEKRLFSPRVIISNRITPVHCCVHLGCHLPERFLRKK